MSESMPEKPRKQRIPWPIALALWAVAIGLALLFGSAALRSGDEAATGSPTPVPIPADLTASNAFLECGDCHGNIDKIFDEGGLPTLTFTHERHFTIGVSDCAACHVANTHEPDKINKPAMLQCYMCHGLNKDAAAPGDCETCHPADLPPEPESHFEPNWLPEQHAVAANAEVLDCFTCHKQTFCDSCHGTEIPHPEGFIEQTHALEFFDTPEVCASCHPRHLEDRRDFCDSCHHPVGPDDTAWVDFHPEAVAVRGAENCFQCHSDQTCRTCHNRGVEDFSADETLYTGEGTPGVTTAPTPSPSPTG